MAICKQLKQPNESQNVFRDLDEDGQETSESKKNQQYDPNLPQNRNIVKFLKQVEKANLFSNLLLNITQRDFEDTTYTNQNRRTIGKIGQKRLKSLELM